MFYDYVKVKLDRNQRSSQIWGNETRLLINQLENKSQKRQIIKEIFKSTWKWLKMKAYNTKFMKYNRSSSWGNLEFVKL